MAQANDFTFLLIAVVSFALVKIGFDTKAFDSISKLLINLCLPSLILLSFSSMGADVFQYEAVFVVVFTAVYIFITYSVARMVLRRYKNMARKEILPLNMAVGNISFLGIPFSALLFGEWGVRLTILSSIAVDFFIFSVVYAMFAGKNSFRQWLGSMLNPCFIAIVVGFGLALMQLQVPAIIRTPMYMLSDMTMPLALLYIGNLLAQNTHALKNIDREAVISIAIKGFALPPIVFVLLTAMGTSRELVLLCTFFTALPAGMFSVIFSKEFNKDIAFANVVFVLSAFIFMAGCLAVYVLMDVPISP